MKIKIRENAKKYFDEELSGEPLYQDLVIDWLTEFAEQQIKLFTVSDISLDKFELKTKVKLIKSIGRDLGMTHPNNVLSIGDVGIIEEISSEDVDGDYPLYYVNFGYSKGYNISRFHWLRPDEMEIYTI